MPRKKIIVEKNTTKKEHIENKTPEIQWKGLIIFVAMFLLIAGSVFYFITNAHNSARKEVYTPYDSSITVHGLEIPFRNNISDFSKVETIPNDLFIAYSVNPNLDYVKYEWSETCAETETCGVISLAAIDVSRAVAYSYTLQTGRKDFVTQTINNSVTILFKRENLLESNISKLNGMLIILRTPGETNSTAVRYYEQGNSSTTIIEGNDSYNFLRAVDKFNYLVLRNVQGR